MNLSMIKQALELRSKLEKTQKELAKIKVEAESGNGAIKVTANGQQKILSIKISPDVYGYLLKLRHMSIITGSLMEKIIDYCVLAGDRVTESDIDEIMATILFRDQ